MKPACIVVACPDEIAPDLARLAVIVRGMPRREIAEMMPDLRELADDLMRLKRASRVHSLDEGV